MKFFFFKKKSSKSSKKTRTTTTDRHQKRKPVADFSVSNSAAHHHLEASSAQGHRRTPSPSYSISSASTQSSLHTIQHAQQEETRGIFRTLEPVWSYLSDHQDADGQWIPLDSDNQRVLELNFTAKQQSKCTISLNHRPLIPKNGAPAATASSTINVYFYPNESPSPPSPSSSSKKRSRRPATQFFALSPSSSPSSSFTQRPQQMKSSPNLTVHSQQQRKNIPTPSPKPSMTEGLYLNQNLRRALVPYWWFETENSQIARFDWKNQVRLEALSEGRSTLTLTDASFPAPFQVILEQTDRSLREECCGLMYLNPSHIIPHPSKHITHDAFINLHPATDLPHDDIFLNRRCSI